MYQGRFKWNLTHGHLNQKECPYKTLEYPNQRLHTNASLIKGSFNF